MQTSTPVLRRRRTKIVATLGPATDDLERIKELIGAGVNVFRMNFSHGTHDQHRAAHGRIRQAEEETESPIAILADLCGPKIRVGEFEGGSIELHVGDELTVTTRQTKGREGLIHSRYAALAKDVSAEDCILLDDGKLSLLVLESDDETEIRCRVLQGGVLSNNKGMNLPGISVSAPSLTDKDREDAVFAMGLGVDYFALSFVRKADDVEDLKTLAAEHEHEISVIAKIEKPEALAEIVEIVGASDGIMVARGDLGVELPPERVPVAQEQLIDLAREEGKPVIVATQMLESMISSATPTRAEVSDVAHAVRSGADGIMLSAETAVGSHPVAAVAMMDRIARYTEGYLWQHDHFDSLTSSDSDARNSLIRVALSRSAAQLSRDLQTRSIVVISRTGVSVREMSSSRPAAPLLALCDSVLTCRRLCLLWGVVPLLLTTEQLKEPTLAAREAARNMGLADEGDYVLLVRGFHLNPALGEPSVTVLTA